MEGRLLQNVKLTWVINIPLTGSSTAFGSCSLSASTGESLTAATEGMCKGHMILSFSIYVRDHITCNCQNFHKLYAVNHEHMLIASVINPHRQDG